MRLKKRKKISERLAIFGFLILFSSILSVPVFSAYGLDYVPLAPIEGTTLTCAQPPCGTNLSYYLTGLFKVGIAVAGVLAFLVIVWGGFTYLSTDVITGKEEGKARVERALGGLIIALAAYILLNTINPQLVKLNLNFGPRAELREGLARPADLISENTNLRSIETLTADRAEFRGMNAARLNQEIQALNAVSQTRGLTAEEEERLVELGIIRDGSTAMNKIDEVQGTITSGLGSSGLPSSLARDARAALEQLRIEVNTRIAAMAATGATVGQMQAVRDRFNTAARLIEACITYRKNIVNDNARANFNRFCK
ncbi:MAG: hypothetical protein HYV67_03780 [Candidatus Taylorbacteria bacterium]|nr:hypothetical protein [Candidatus Taylorbacteria bacterium]